ncbi:general secretion pathway protein GspB [Aliamphritea hakodatensis]|uniref:general secretion pathway protein GspB n=1 Tax=Aliamphritea hakodatensis TaxID=2895352 RepID=UPI0022FDA20F|nr:general secretion pathway protein GspB [Aliamphritea hakodatensis]
MSYILDSLKRSDKERTLGSVPTLQSLPLISDTPPRKRTINAKWLVISAALLLAAYTASLLIMSDTPVRVTAHTPVQSTAAIAGENVIPAEKTTDTQNIMNPEVIPTEHATSVTSDDLPEIKPHDGFGISSSTQNRLKGVKVQLQDHKTKAPSQPEAQQAATVTQPKGRSEQPVETTSESSLSAAEQSIRPRLLTAPEKLPPTATKHKNPPARDPYQGILHARQLPEGLKRELPELNFSVHIYSANAASRMVKINGRSYRQGENVSQGLRLDEITRDGVIMTFKAQRFWQLSR